MNILLIVSIALYLISNGKLAIRFMFIMVRSLQLIMHLPMMQVIFPGNAMTLIVIIIPVVGFDILEALLDWEQVNEHFEIFNFSEHEKVSEKIFAQITELGYETFNSIMILNTIGFILIFYILKVVLWFLLRVCLLFCRNNDKIKSFTEKLSGKIFFNELFQLYAQGFFEFLIAALLTYKLKQYELLGEKLSAVIAVISFFVCLIFMPLASIYVIY